MARAGHVFICVLMALTLLAARPAAALTSSDVVVGVKGNMHAVLIAPDGAGPYPGVLVLHTSGGLQRADIEFARHLAENGYACLVPSFMATYGITGPTRALTFTTYAEPIYADFVQAIDMLRRNDKVRGSKIGAVGFSNGGYFVAWLAATAKIQAGVSYYGAYTGANTDRELSRFHGLFSAASAPLLILHGSADAIVPVHSAERLAGLAEGAKAPVELHIYSNATHVFERGDPGGGRPLGTRDPDAAADAWQRTLAFYAKYLK
jgi:carboxymethylenebutenolidase